jgi:hypothetical protein
LKDELAVPDITAEFLNKVLQQFDVAQLNIKYLTKLQIKLNTLFEKKNQFDEFKVRKEDQAKIMLKLQEALRRQFI